MSWNNFKDSISKDNIVASVYMNIININKIENDKLDLLINIDEVKKEKESKEKEIIKVTDFKKLGITNQPGRDAYIYPMVKELDDDIFSLENALKRLEIREGKLKKLNRLRENLLSKINEYDEVITDEVVSYEASVPV